MTGWKCDLAALVGVVLTAVGLWWIYPPSAMVGVGVLMVIVAVAFSRRTNRDLR